MSDELSAAAGEDKSERRLKKAERMLDTRVLDPWERYRALSDLHDATFDVAEFADRKARFALVIVGALNARNFIIVTQPRFVGELAPEIRPWLALYVTGYAILSLWFFVYAIQTLRPRISTFPRGAASKAHAGLRFIPDIVSATADEYYERWSSVQIGQINREIALHVQVLSRINDAKFRSLDRVFKGLLALTGLTAVMVSAVAYFVIMR
jgi:hypothetical protein